MSAVASPVLRREAEAETFDRTAQPPAIEASCAFALKELNRRTPGKRLLLTVPAPTRKPEALLRAAGQQAAVLWAPPASPREPAFAGLGCAHRIAVQGPERLTQLRVQAEALWATLEHRVQGESPAAPEPRLFGGLAFEAGWATEAPWPAFGDGAFTLPRLVYRNAAAGATLTLATDDQQPPERWVETLRWALETLEGLPAWEGEAGAGLSQPPPVIRMDRLSEARWIEQVEAIREVIRQGEFRKIVAASRSRVHLARAVDPADVLSRLADQICSTRFAFFRPGAAFLGATPERLVSKVGNHIETEALAGSIAAGSEQAARLLESPKDQQEHHLVVQHILRRLQPLCHGLTWSETPEIRALRNVLHLLTPIRGELNGGGHILDVVAALHPTPAVGGVPAAPSIHWIVEREVEQRGWYAGPVGWFDAAGDGELNVALRSCVLAGDVAYVYAGAGIVRDSDPHLEYLETELKERAILAALGVGAAHHA